MANAGVLGEGAAAHGLCVAKNNWQKHDMTYVCVCVGEAVATQHRHDCIKYYLHLQKANAENSSRARGIESMCV